MVGGRGAKVLEIQAAGPRPTRGGRAAGLGGAPSVASRWADIRGSPQLLSVGMTLRPLKSSHARTPPPRARPACHAAPTSAPAALWPKVPATACSPRRHPTLVAPAARAANRDRSGRGRLPAAPRLGAHPPPMVPWPPRGCRCAAASGRRCPRRLDLRHRSGLPRGRGTLPRSPARPASQQPGRQPQPRRPARHAVAGDRPHPRPPDRN
jgi:hypothetical protein